VELQYYVLGKKNNPMLKEYLESYYEKICLFLEELSHAWILTDEISQLFEHRDNKDFLSKADITSLIHAIHQYAIQKKSWWPDPQEHYVNQLAEQIGFLLSWDHDRLIYNQWEKIGGTNIRLTKLDYNPHWLSSSHPDHDSNGAWVGWWDKSETEWLEIFNKTFEALKKVDEDVYDELNQVIDKIVPYGTAMWLHNSCSHKDCVGHLYMWYTLGVDMPEFNNLEAIIHESSHNKLNLIMQRDKLILSDMSEKYYSAYRPDARHIHGVYLWLHAFAPVIYILMKAYRDGLMGTSSDWLEKIVLYYLKNKVTYKVLVKHGKFTELWQHVLDEMKYVLDLTDALFQQIPSAKQTFLIVKDHQRLHFMEVNTNYPHLEY